MKENVTVLLSFATIVFEQHVLAKAKQKHCNLESKLWHPRLAPFKGCGARRVQNDSWTTDVRLSLPRLITGMRLQMTS